MAWGKGRWSRKAPLGTAEKNQKEEQVGKWKPLGKRCDWIDTCLELLKHTSRVGCGHPCLSMN